MQIVFHFKKGSKPIRGRGGGGQNMAHLRIVADYDILPVIHDFSANGNRLEVQHRVLFDRLDLSLVLAH